MEEEYRGHQGREAQLDSRPSTSIFWLLRGGGGGCSFPFQALAPSRLNARALLSHQDLSQLHWESKRCCYVWTPGSEGWSIPVALRKRWEDTVIAHYYLEAVKSAPRGLQSSRWLHDRPAAGQPRTASSESPERLGTRGPLFTCRIVTSYRIA